MRQIIKSIVLLVIACCAQGALAQTDTSATPADSTAVKSDIVTTESESLPEFSSGTYGSSLRIINGHSANLLEKGSLEFCIQHRFGQLSNGYYGAWGFDQSNIRIGFDYGVFSFLTLGAGRSGMGKTANGYMKWGIANEQKNGKFSMSLVSDMAYVFERNTTGLEPWYYTHRINYTHQLILSKSYSGKHMLQIAPTLVHRNLVDSVADANTVPLLAMAGRLKLSNRISLTGEYTLILNDRLNKQINPSAGIGLELWTGGHVFQITCTNANTLNEPRFLTGQNGDISKGELRLGFNIVRRW